MKIQHKFRTFIIAITSLFLYCALPLQFNAYAMDDSLTSTANTTEVTLRTLLSQMSPLVLLVLFIILILIITALAAVVRMKSKGSRTIQKMMYTDELTGLISYKKFLIEVQKLVKNAPEERLALIYVDIDGFKYINGTYGYEEGDALLVEISKKLSEFIREGEFLSRIFADNFIMVFRYAEQEEVYNRLYALEDLQEGKQYQSVQGYHLVFSGGVYFMEGAGESIPVAIDRAHYAKDLCKDSYNNKVMTYNKKINQDIEKEKELEGVMKDALANGEFVPYYQGKVDITTNQIVGGEALSRWNRPGKGMVEPKGFIPFFEKSGFIVNLDKFIFEEVCKQLRIWLDQGFKVPTISCNFSRLHFRNEHFAEELKETAEKYRIPPKLLELEITETVAMEQPEQVAYYIGKLRIYGFRVAIDDFGIGYSSLSVLDQVIIDVLKLDRNFFVKSTNDKVRRAIVRRLVQLAHDINIEVVCEGIETEEQEDLLLEIGCTVAQGFKYARPEPVEEFETRLLQQA